MLQQELKDDATYAANTKQTPMVEVQLNFLNNLSEIAADSLKDIDVYDDDGDDDDPELLNELSQIIEPNEKRDAAAVDLPTTTGSSVLAEVPALLTERIEMYKVAEANATSANESCRARRFARGLSTLETMLKEALSGKTIKMDDIPPEVTTKVKDGSDSKPVE